MPEGYIRFIKESGLFEGFTHGEPGYIRLWPPEKLAEINSDILIKEFAPDFLAFASDGGNEIIAFDNCGVVFKLPMIGMEPQYAIRIAGSFEELSIRFQGSVEP